MHAVTGTTVTGVSTLHRAKMSLNPHAAATLLLTVGALYLFTRTRLSMYWSCIIVLLCLVAGFELVPFSNGDSSFGAREIFAGFGNEALITIVLLLMLAKGVEVSGALQPLSRLLARLWIFNGQLAFIATLLIAAVLSAFVNNTPIVVILLPLLIGVAHRTKRSPSKILMPVGFASIVGGMSTTIGTSTNLLVANVARDLGAVELGMFDFALPAAVAGCIAIVFLWLASPHLLPDRPAPLSGTASRVFESIFEIPEASALSDKSLGEIRKSLPANVTIMRVERSGRLELMRLPTLRFRAGDRIHVRGTPESIKAVHDLFRDGQPSSEPRRLPDYELAEIVVTRDSALFRKRLSEARRVTFGKLLPVGVMTPKDRPKAGRGGALDDPLLEAGDVILVQGHRNDIRELQQAGGVLVVRQRIPMPRSSKARRSLLIMAGVVISAALGLLPILAAAFCGFALMLFFRCLDLNDARSAIDTNLVLVIATSLALGTALTQTGAADFLAHAFVSLVGGLPPPIVLSGMLLLTALLTEVVTNNAVAVIATPIAITVAQNLGVSETAFVLAVLFGANMSYLTPIGYQTNLLVCTAGGYHFADFMRLGVPLQLLMWISLSVLLAILYL